MNTSQTNNNQKYPQMESNHHLEFRKLLFYPLNYEGK